MIELVDVNAFYGPHHVIKGVSKIFHSGHIYGIIGLNGAGKTTLFNILSGSMNYSGSLVFPEKLNHSLRKEVAMLPTVPYFFPQSTGEEYLAFIQYAKGVVNPAVNNIFDVPLGKYVASYSTGMKKKIAFTGLLIGEHEVYILDEPFNDVDLIGNVKMKNEIIKLRAGGKTVLIASHILSTLTDICDEILLLCDGIFKRTFQKEEFILIEEQLLVL